VQPETPAAEYEQVPRLPPGPVPAPIVNPTTEHRTDGPRLQVAAAAHRVGGAPSTLRTWDRRYGIGPTGHTPGQHRRYSPDDLARLDLMHRALILGATPADAAAHALNALPPHPDAARPPPATTGRPGAGTPTGDVPAGAEPGERQPAGAGSSDRPRARTGGTALRLPGAGWRARGLGRAALALDADTVRGLLTESIAVTGVQATWDDVTRPVLAAVAQRWADTGAGIEIEHLLSDCVTGVFSAVAAAAAPAGTARPVLLAGMAGDQHRLPLVVLAATLAQRGASCRSLGTDLPPTALATAIRRTAPAALLLWSQLSSTADPQVLRSLPRTRPGYRGFVAGPGWAEVELPPQVGRLESLEEAADALSAAATV
jgi:MerR family transcriptional regulator, light-induced transcriptional regulator